MSETRALGVVLLAMLAPACGGSVTPTSPSRPLAASASVPATVAAAPVPSEAAGDRWNLTTTFRSATGPQGCAVDISHMHVGDSSPWVMTIERSGGTVHLIVADVRDPTYRYDYDGTMAADILTAAITSFSTAGWCGERGGRVEFQAEHHVSGHFSTDGHAFMAEEVQSMKLTSGEALTLSFDWSATRQ